MIQDLGRKRNVYPSPPRTAPKEVMVEFDRFNITVKKNPRTIIEDGCTVIHPDDCDLPQDVWLAMPRPRDEIITIVSAPLAERTTGGVLVDEQIREIAVAVSFMGIVLAIGDACWRREKWMVLVEDEDGTYKRRLLPPPCAIGDTIIFGRQSAFNIPVHAIDATASHHAVDFRFLHSQAVNGIAPFPDQIQQCEKFGL